MRSVTRKWCSRAEIGAANVTNNYYHIYTSNPGPTMAVEELVSVLTNKQPVVDYRISHASPKNILPELIEELLAKKNPREPQALLQAEEDTINLVAMFFDSVLDDEALPILVQSLLGRLQIPVLKFR